MPPKHGSKASPTSTIRIDRIEGGVGHADFDVLIGDQLICSRHPGLCSGSYLFGVNYPGNYPGGIEIGNADVASSDGRMVWHYGGRDATSVGIEINPTDKVDVELRGQRQEMPGHFQLRGDTAISRSATGEGQTTRIGTIRMPAIDYRPGHENWAQLSGYITKQGRPTDDVVWIRVWPRGEPTWASTTGWPLWSFGNDFNRNGFYRTHPLLPGHYTVKAYLNPRTPLESAFSLDVSITKTGDRIDFNTDDEVIKIRPA